MERRVWYGAVSFSVAARIMLLSCIGEFPLFECSALAAWEKWRLWIATQQYYKIGTPKGWIMESFATPYPVIFFDGEQDQDKGYVGVHSVLTFKRFQALMSQKTGVHANQLSAVFVCKKAYRDMEKRQKLPINESTNFSIILNQHNPSREKDCYFLVSMKKSKKDRKVSRKRSAEADNNADDDESISSPEALSPISAIDWSSPLESGGSESSGSVSPTIDMAADGKLELTLLRRQDTVQSAISRSRSELHNAVSAPQTEDSSIAISKMESDSSSVPQSPKPGNSNLQSEDQMKLDIQGIQKIPFVASDILPERYIGQRPFHLPLFNVQMPNTNLFSQERYSDAMPQIPNLRPHVGLMRNGIVSPGYAATFNRTSTMSPSFSPSILQPSLTPFGARLPPSSISSAGFFPSRSSFHNSSGPLAFAMMRDISLQRMQTYMLQVQQRDSQICIASHDLPRYNTGFCNWVPAVTGQGDRHENICEVCYDCKRKSIAPTPFHWCVQDRITMGFRGPSPAGPIERPGKRQVDVAA